MLAAAGHAAPVLFHFALENRRLEPPERRGVGGGLRRRPAARARHLALHDRHLIAINDRDRPFVTGELLAQQRLALSRDGWRERLAMLASMGATEIAYQPAGPDIPGELERFASLVQG